MDSILFVAAGLGWASVSLVVWSVLYAGGEYDARTETDF